ncbi:MULTISPECIES: galactose-binding domain-containing protein [Paenibacillus]|uniref:galactose-binding domain-containing protein n=1 Tax=Paenibacillus TaxID=44249 RepID=UPI0022B92946|nr:discoidin domain-containing protein [Paenibacillus caseinilyticus]MCZ8518428.1 discoidin domain-containing protein [Paenibacillus caseinilyticus]
MKLNRKRAAGAKRTVLSTLALFTALSPLSLSNLQTARAAEPYLLSQNRTVYASSVEGGNSPDLAVDGSEASRWSSAWGADPQWLYTDLGAVAAISRVVIHWEGAYAKAYKVQVSNDESTWTDVYSTTAGDGGVDEVALNTSGRYVRVLGTERALPNYGYSILELEVFGTGGVNTPPVKLGPNVALNRPVKVSSYEQADYLPPGSTLPENGVDGNRQTRWSSNPTDNEYYQVDLGSQRTIGRIILDWEAAAGRAFDLQVSSDGNQWTTVYRELKGQGGVQNIPVYATGRYVRMQGISRATSFGYSLFEFQVYDYVNGDPKPVHTIPPLPVKSVVTEGSGSYLRNDITMPQPKFPHYKSDSIQKPLPSNDWWQSLFINKLGNGIITLPLKSKFQSQGLGIMTPGSGWITPDGKAVETGTNFDLSLMASNINTASMTNRVTSYGDFSVDTVLSDSATEDKMKVTFVKGSPYIYAQFSDPNSAEIYSPAITRLFNDANGSVLAADGATLTADHIGIEVTNTNGAPTPAQVKRYYALNAPAGTVFKRVGPKIKITLPSGQNYLSLAALPSPDKLNYYYQHGYAFVTDTKVGYQFDESTSAVETTFTATTALKRAGFPNTTLMALLPHQWKIASTPLTELTYPSIRGTMKVSEGNSFKTADRFNGIVPQFTEPSGNGYDRQQLLDQLAILDQSTDTTEELMKADAYWQGKTLHPLAMGVLIADQIGDASYKSKFLARLKTALTDWYTYTQGEPNYFLYYNDDWGTMYYKNSEFGANVGITDHHFTYGYFVFSSAVLATYDKDFETRYGGMVEQLIRDYANPSRTDAQYPFFRSFDPYSGHSWAGGYADQDNGNNQEAAGESLFGWVGQYMWSILKGNTAYRDAAIWGFTTELKAVEQYWFNYDNDNWIPEYKHKSVGQIYGSSQFFGTFFNGNPVYVYGIHWLPTSEYLTSYGFDPAKAASLYQGFVKDNGGAETDWQHIVWPVQALSDPQAVLAKWNPAVLQQNEAFNTYYFVHSMATLGQRTKDVWATGWSSATVYKKGTTYTAQVWNPTDAPVTVTFRNASGVTGTATVAAKSLVSVNPMTNSGGTTQPSANVALKKTTVASSTEDGYTAVQATDGNASTRWASAWNDAEWIYVDLGASYNVSRIKLNWEGAYAKGYKLQISDDPNNWTGKDVFVTAAGDGGVDDVTVTGKGRYVRMLGTARALPFGYSLFDFEVYGTKS